MRQQTGIAQHNNRQGHGARLPMNGLVILAVLYIGYLITSSSQT